MASTSEIYGDPLVHPQTEDYLGNVNTIGPRACYDEAKRFSEAYVSTAIRGVGRDPPKGVRASPSTAASFASSIPMVLACGRTTAESSPNFASRR